MLQNATVLQNKCCRDEEQREPPTLVQGIGHSAVLQGIQTPQCELDLLKRLRQVANRLEDLPVPRLQPLSQHQRSRAQPVIAVHHASRATVIPICRVTHRHRQRRQAAADALCVTWEAQLARPTFTPSLRQPECL